MFQANCCVSIADIICSVYILFSILTYISPSLYFSVSPSSKSVFFYLINSLPIFVLISEFKVNESTSNYKAFHCTQIIQFPIFLRIPNSITSISSRLATLDIGPRNWFIAYDLARNIGAPFFGLLYTVI